jgi:hypothetical protein
MRFDPCQCPRCGEGPSRILATVETVTRLDQLEDGSFEFDDGAVSWETQTPLITEGKVTLYCRHHHGYVSELVAEPAEQTIRPEVVAEPDDLEPDDNVLIALTLLVVHPGIRDYLAQHDPALLWQARNAMYVGSGLLPIDGKPDQDPVTTAGNTSGDTLQTLRDLAAALEFYPHWKPEMPGFLLGIVRTAIANETGGAS